MRKGLIVFAREPIAGKVKTRLAATVGNEVAAKWYETMLQDVLNTTRQLSDVETVVFWACDENSLPLLTERYRCRAHYQGSGDLGQRMQTACIEMFSRGVSICCIIGSDSPDIPLAYIQSAYQLLAEQRHDVVVGPSSDGGYYLLGMKQVYPQLFRNISWSTSDVLRQSLEAARTAGLTVALLPEWHDIDTYEDLQAYQRRNRQTPLTDPQ
ncbi:MAG: TIGR04282 family arsenosugar biosynthesis glycosyltransferase [Desulfuromonadaceae bacterium]|nr:TIGR04282 family arsenosugar biosynthesis glycosyltransferase [Desulfuromonadaceae bacterium]